MARTHAKAPRESDPNQAALAELLADAAARSAHRNRWEHVERMARSLLRVAVERSILLVRGQKVMLDADLATLYDVPPKRLNEAVKRNRGRFPDDFMFQLTRGEFDNLRSQSATSRLWGGRRYLPFVFTEQGVAMLSSVLHSERAIEVNIEIMRAFVRLRQMLASHTELARRLNDLEKKYDEQFKAVFDAMRALMEPPPAKVRGKIGFLSELKKDQEARGRKR